MKTLSEDIIEQLELQVYEAGVGYDFVNNYLRNEDPENFTEQDLKCAEWHLAHFKYCLKTIKAIIEKHKSD